MRSLPITELQKLPYIHNLPADQRTTLLHPYYDHQTKDWVLYLPVSSDELGRIGGGEPVVGPYFAEQAADPSRDLLFPLGTLIAQYLSYQDVVGVLESLESDIFEIASILKKYDLISTHCRTDTMSTSILLSSELDHLIIQLRRLYDILQKLSKNLSRHIKRVDDMSKKLMSDLGESFADVVLQGDQPRTVEELQSRYRLTPSLAQFYANEAERFKRIRKLRLGLEHHGKSLPTIFCIDAGAAVPYQETPWIDFGPWEAEHIRQDQFGSLRLLFARLASDAIDLTTRYLKAFCSEIAVQEPLSDRIQLFLRHPFGAYLVDLPKVLAAPWESETPSTQQGTCQ